MAEKAKQYLTVAERDELERERRHLLDVERPENIEQLELARSQGDLSENADYDAARERQAQIEGRIKEIESILNNAILLEENERTSGSSNKISIGDIVVFERDDGREIKVRISGNIGANPETVPPTVSNESPIGKALLGQKVGAKLRVECGNPYGITIKEIQH